MAVGFEVSYIFKPCAVWQFTFCCLQIKQDVELPGSSPASCLPAYPHKERALNLFWNKSYYNEMFLLYKNRYGHDVSSQSGVFLRLAQVHFCLEKIVLRELGLEKQWDDLSTA